MSYPQDTKEEDGNQSSRRELKQRQNYSKPIQSRDSGYGSSDEDESEDIKIFSSHKKIIKKWLFGDKDSVRSENWNKRLKKISDGRNIIHQIIFEMNKEPINDQNSVVLSNALDLVESVVLEKPDLLLDWFMNDENKTPLFEAAKSQISVVFRIVDLLIPLQVVERLKPQNCEKNQPCALLEVAEARRNQCKVKKEKENDSDTRLDEGSQKSVPGAVTESEGLLNSVVSCLHDSVSVTQVLKNNSRLQGVLEEALSKPQALEGCIKPLLNAKNFDGGSQILSPERFKELLQLCPSSLFENSSVNTLTPLQTAIQLYESLSIDYVRLHSVICALIERFPASIFQKTLQGRTAYYLLKQLPDTRPESYGSHYNDSRRDTEQVLKEICIGSQEKSLQEKREFLYRDAKSHQQFHLNLMGESGLLGNEYIEEMIKKSGMNFETVLAFVKLPYWNSKRSNLPNPKSIEHIQRPQGEQQNSSSEVTKVESDPYREIFAWLWRSNVRKIFTLEVDDDGIEPHTNAAIRSALCLNNKDNNKSKGFDIEIWKWKKFDICSDTVATAVPNAREVYLYSRGNTAVLRGWAYGSSFSKLKKLRKLVIEIHPQNSNDREDCESYKTEFISNIKRQCPWVEEINFDNPQFQDREQHIEGVGKNRKNEKNLDPYKTLTSVPNTSEWLSMLDDFMEFILNLGLTDTSSTSVRVALLDDGCKLDHLQGVNQRGESFRPDQTEFFVGACDHGTEMARCIRDVCPKAELYIARLDDSQEYENQRFTISSCCHALQWAIDMDVDVISMSWTFKRRTPSDAEEEEFKDLVKQASNKGILLFGALPNKNMAEDIRGFAPVGLDQVIKIGSATVFGESSKGNGFARPDFIFPGENIQLSTGELANGSSFSTAFASGLAALVLYCLKAQRVFSQLDETDTRYKALRKAKTADGMKDIFSHMGQNLDGKSDAAPFVQPYPTFRKESFTTDEDRKAVLDRISQEILPDNLLRNFY